MLSRFAISVLCMCMYMLDMCMYAACITWLVIVCVRVKVIGCLCCVRCLYLCDVNVFHGVIRFYIGVNV